MYTEKDYARDLYIKENGSGYEKDLARIRCIDFEHGRDPEYRFSEDGRRQIEAEKKHRSKKWGCPAIICMLLAIVGTQVGPIMLLFFTLLAIIFGILAWD